MMDKKFLLDCINEIIDERKNNAQLEQKIFSSEAEFQFALAWKLKEKLIEKKQEAQIYLETKPYVVGLKIENNVKFLTANSRIDIILELDGKLYPIELKYKYLKQDRKNAGGQNNFLLGFHKDVCKMEEFQKQFQEQFKNCGKNCEKFFCIAITNQTCIYKSSGRTGTNNEELRLDPECKPCSFEVNKNKTINLTHEKYNCKWANIKDMEDINDFQILIIENEDKIE